MKDNWFSFPGAYPGYIITQKKNIQKRDGVGLELDLKGSAHTVTGRCEGKQEILV